MELLLLFGEVLLTEDFVMTKTHILLQKSDCAQVLLKAIELSSCTKLQDKSNGEKGGSVQGNCSIRLLCL